MYLSSVEVSLSSAHQLSNVVACSIRNERDLNPRKHNCFNALAKRLVQPLRHHSKKSACCLVESVKRKKCQTAVSINVQAGSTSKSTVHFKTIQVLYNICLIINNCRITEYITHDPKSRCGVEPLHTSGNCMHPQLPTQNKGLLFNLKNTTIFKTALNKTCNIIKSISCFPCIFTYQ